MMKIFGAKEEGGEEKEDLELKREVTFPSKKKFKDLIPENRKRRKEPVKPWGKKERVLVLFVLLGTILTSAFLAGSARGWKIGSAPRLSLVLPGQETIVIEANKENEEKTRKAIKAFTEAANDYSGVYGLYVYRLEDKSGYGIYEDEIFTAASLIKLPVLATLYKEAELGNIDLGSKYTLKESDKIAGSGSLFGKAVGTKITFREMAQLMGKQSDNTAFYVVRKSLGDEKITALIKDIRMEKTSLEENDTTPKDIGTFFRKLWNNEVVIEKYRDEILSYLTDTIYEDRIPAGIPDGVRVAHKIGTEVGGAYSDAGIIFSKKPFVLAIMTKGALDKEIKESFPKLARIIWDIEGNN